MFFLPHKIPWLAAVVATYGEEEKNDKLPLICI